MTSDQPNSTFELYIYSYYTRAQRESQEAERSKKKKRVTFTHRFHSIQHKTNSNKCVTQINPRKLIIKKGEPPPCCYRPVSVAEAASWAGTAVRSGGAEPPACAPGGARRAACGGVKGTWGSPGPRSSPQALLVAAAYWWVGVAAENTQQTKLYKNPLSWEV